jgi:hypothetical protein
VESFLLIDDIKEGRRILMNYLTGTSRLWPSKGLIED